ncbi:MAG: ATP-dependent DNA ligase [Rhodobacteraceae bacterium]|jgi:DNA ligase-1|nr:ATP-dependent DNA ligase [Paracoccaceae bacterium]
MRRFADLYARLDETTSTSRKVAALADYFRDAPEQDRVWTVALLSGRRPKRTVTATRLAEWAAARAGIPMWLFTDSYAATGDLAETIALILPPGRGGNVWGLSDWIDTVRALAVADDAGKQAGVQAAWDVLADRERMLFNKLLTGGLRVGVSQKLMTRALAQATGLDEADLALRLMGDWDPARATWAGLILAPDPGADLSRPYPFALAHQLDDPLESLGDPADWAAEWKWDGIRGQIVLRGGDWHLWSRGEEVMTDRFPEFARLADYLPPGTVIDGEVLAWDTVADAPQPFAALQPRIGRKSVPKKLLASAPARMLAYDLLEWGGQDIRARPFAERRAALEAAVAALPPAAPMGLSPLVEAPDWAGISAARDQSRDRGAEGLMLKRRASPYGVGRKRGDWWKWKVDPFTVDAVMVYAQAGHGRRATLYTDFTFAVWDDTGALVPFTKAYSGLTDAEFAEITAWVRRNTTDRFGPVRAVRPDLVFELAFEGIQASPRHKSGIALRFPRMVRWRRDKPAAEADRLETLRALLAGG